MIHPFVVGMAGGTASGKTTIARRVAERTGAALLTHDRYYKNADASTNFDHPDALETERLVEDLDRLRSGEAAELPIYDFATHTRLAEFERLEPRPLVVVEGILVLTSAALRERFDLTVYVEASADVRLIRRVKRDMAERGRSLDSVLAQYMATVRPMHTRFVQPAAAHAGIVLDGEGSIEAEVERLVRRLPGFGG